MVAFLPDFLGVSLWLVVAMFVVAAAGVWLAGTKLSGYVDLIADRTGVGEVFAGALLLGGATSLPELATSISAAASGAALLAGSNLFGGIVLQLAVLAVVDLVALRGRSLTFFSPHASILLQGVFLIVVVAMGAAAVTTGELVSVAGVGLWPVLITVVYVVGLWSLNRYEADARWALRASRSSRRSRPGISRTSPGPATGT